MNILTYFKKHINIKKNKKIFFIFLKRKFYLSFFILVVCVGVGVGGGGSVG